MSSEPNSELLLGQPGERGVIDLQPAGVDAQQAPCLLAEYSTTYGRTGISSRNASNSATDLHQGATEPACRSDLAGHPDLPGPHAEDNQNRRPVGPQDQRIDQQRHVLSARTVLHPAPAITLATDDPAYTP